MSTLVNTPASWSERAASPCPLEAVGWTQDGQRSRFGKVLELLDPQPGETLLDYGCGTGALVDRVPVGVGYVGYDWARGMVERARRDHPGVVFFDRAFELRVDVVACIGTFNLPGTKTGTWETIRLLWSQGPRALAVSLYAGDDDRCLVYTEDETLEALQGLTASLTVGRWRPNDLIAVLRR